MITALDCYSKYGDPFTNKSNMVLWDVPSDIEIGLIPKKIYCNNDLIAPLLASFIKLIETGCVRELKTYDGCYNVRVIRGYEKKYQLLKMQGLHEQANRLMSIHSWGVAIDLNAFENQLNQTPKLSTGFVNCFKESGFDWGGDFKRKDGMHFQLSKLPLS